MFFSKRQYYGFHCSSGAARTHRFCPFLFFSGSLPPCWGKLILRSGYTKDTLVGGLLGLDHRHLFTSMVGFFWLGAEFV